jgi:hypothetical protein
VTAKQEIAKNAVRGISKVWKSELTIEGGM